MKITIQVCTMYVVQGISSIQESWVKSDISGTNWKLKATNNVGPTHHLGTFPRWTSTTELCALPLAIRSLPYGKLSQNKKANFTQILGYKIGSWFFLKSFRQYSSASFLIFWIFFLLISFSFWSFQSSHWHNQSLWNMTYTVQVHHFHWQDHVSWSSDSGSFLDHQELFDHSQKWEQNDEVWLWQLMSALRELFIVVAQRAMILYALHHLRTVE